MSEEENPPGPPPEGPPKLRLVDDRQNKSRPVSPEMYEKLWEIYRDLKERSINALARSSGLNHKTCTKAVNIGWPHRDWPSLRERAKLWDRRVQESADKPLSAKQLIDLERFVGIREQNLSFYQAVRSMASRMFIRAQAALETAVATRTYKRHRIIQEQRGNKIVERVVQEDVEMPPYLPHLASAMKDMASMAISAGEGERMWAKIIPPEGADGGETGWEGLTDEQHRYIIENGGKLPPGLSAEQLKKR